MRWILEKVDFAIWVVRVTFTRGVRYLLDPMERLAGAIAYRLEKWFARWHERLTQWDWPPPIRFLLRHLRAAGFRIYVWIRTREARYLLQGAPALLVAGCIAFVLFAQTIRPQNRDVERYRNSVRSALVEEDWEAADLWLQKLAMLGWDDDETRYHASIVATHVGSEERAERLLRELAPDDAVGYPEAHFWVATGRRWEEDDLDLVIHHLQAATRSRFATRVHKLLADIYASQGEHRKALLHLSKIAEEEPDVRFRMAGHYESLGDGTAATVQLDRARQHYRDQVEADRDDVDARLHWATACALQGFHAKAESIVQEGLRLSPDPRLANALAGIYASMAAQLQSNDAKLGLRLGLLERALAYSPSHRLALGELTRFLPLDGNQPPVGPADLYETLADGQATSIVHLILAVYDQHRGDVQPAMLHLKQAYRLHQGMPYIVNNLAILLVREDPPQHARALELVTLALQLQPQDLQLRKTRGQILASREQWSEALLDLEAALDEMAGNPDLHLTLAQVYGQLGNDELARTHQELAREAQDEQEKAGSEQESEDPAELAGKRER